MSRRPNAGITNGRRGRPTRAEEIEAGLRCECGQRLATHPPLPAPKAWGHGRPCGRESLGQFASGSSFLERRVRRAR